MSKKLIFDDIISEFHVIINPMKKGILFLVLALSLMALQLANFASASELTDDYFDIASNYYNSNNLAKALEYLDLIMIIEPNNLTAKTLRDKISPPAQIADAGCAVSPDSQVAEQVSIVETPQKIIEKVTYDSDYYNTKGQEFYQRRDYNLAIEYFCKSITLNNKNAQAYNNLAMTYWGKNDVNSAIQYFKKAHWINRNYSQPLVNLSNLYKQLGNEKKQVYYLYKAIQCNCNDYLAYYWLGDYYRSLGKYPDAIKNYKEVVKINPKFSPVYLSLAISFFETEEFSYSLIALDQYREFCPDSDYALYLMARAEMAICQYDEAKTYVQKAIQINSNNEYLFELAKIDYSLEDYSTALEILQTLLQSGDNAEYFNYVGLCNYKLKNIEVAIANFNKAIDLDGLRPIYYYNLAQCYKSIGDKKNYVKYVNTATKINPINYQDFIDLSYIYFDNSNPNYAINALNGAIRKYPDVKSLYLSKLKIYEAIGDNLHYNETKDLIEMRFNRR